MKKTVTRHKYEKKAFRSVQVIRDQKSRKVDNTDDTTHRPKNQIYKEPLFDNENIIKSRKHIITMRKLYNVKSVKSKKKARKLMRRNVLRWKNEFRVDLFFAIGEVYFLDT